MDSHIASSLEDWASCQEFVTISIPLPKYIYIFSFLSVTDLVAIGGLLEHTRNSRNAGQIL